ncbi:MAG: hypothetical protein A2494_03385 [Candidatus Lloydbacteria bacterium RIFOXYC12_FULL_46_25]|uniref:histidine kinase n=1 Tax=Candidatus Lloydbacteria bacterium RIFOXYC12_FULL_46_25 TaxID=1798670 RepID=A0A1G2E3B0_9BACT|nr:MAG: hypothetical protein A2494_03385 [Candidatus Lloydbacteria bacterium RIFOXYC12_FULL_46_25]
MEKDLRSETRIRSTRWVIDARWYYLTAAFFFAMIAKEPSAFVDPFVVLLTMLIIFVCANIFFHYRLIKISNTGDVEGSLDRLNVTQITADLLFFFFVLIFTGGGVHSIGHIFFFVPIIVSMILLGSRGAIRAALASGALVFLSVLIHGGVFTFPTTSTAIEVHLRVVAPELTEASVIFLFYLLTGFFGGYVSRLIHDRDVRLLEQIKKEEEHVNRLEELTKEFDKSAKLLVRRDIQLTVANDKLTLLDKMKSEIISVVAHQLRTPLAAIKWTLKILLDEDVGKVTPAQKELLMKGFDSNERMIILVNDMLAVDKLESGKLKYSFVPVQFESLVQEMIGTLLPLATQKNIRVEFVTPQQPLSKIRIDPDKMRDVLQNLIDNAIKYSKENTTITVGVEMKEKELHFWVRDAGIGIPEEEKDKIFSRFFRAANAVHTQTDGSGLGLFIALSVVRRHGGTITFESVLDQGTTFHVLLPFIQ